MTATKKRRTVPRGHCGRCDRCGCTLLGDFSHTAGGHTRACLKGKVEPRTHCAGCGLPYEDAVPKPCTCDDEGGPIPGHHAPYCAMYEPVAPGPSSGAVTTVDHAACGGDGCHDCSETGDEVVVLTARRLFATDPRAIENWIRGRELGETAAKTARRLGRIPDNDTVLDRCIRAEPAIWAECVARAKAMVDR